MAYELPINFSFELAERAQRLLALKVKTYDDFERPIKLVGGADVAWKGDIAVGCITVHEYPSLRLLERSISIVESSFPYIPTFLSFREIKPLMAALSKLSIKPTILFVNGQGIAHPRRLGLASHLGVVADIPTIGVAQKVLCGRATSPLTEVGYVELIDEVEGSVEIIGYLYRSSKRFRPICISVGHRVGLKTALELTKSCIRSGVKLPIPLHSSHKGATKEAAKIDPSKRSIK
ncbi:MAG: endonuclease V [Candidatus Nezhaarchaeales archaeon]|nr:MAG: endonuclease V [Candidatus Nezhaarchaeota archaeon WYZ-LMO8]TDA36514.1 MAG: endonuclease V [Candidatus Nezhaarchaeota archaeon WYZ-LMO7]